MQKRARILDNKNIKRLHINRRGRSDISQSGSSTFFYIRMLVTWASMVALDAMTGFRFELLWPTWLMVRAAVESIQMRNQHCVTTIANPTAARFSVLFVCVTATSDLICYLFIPIRMLIFIATTYVWINLYCHTQGGFLRTIATLYGGDRSQSWSILLITCFIVAFELFLRIRSHPILISIFPNVTEWAGVSPVWPRSLNAFFGAHSLGYPAVLITVSLHYYFNEWKLRRKQGEVSNRNEQLFRILVESLPADYEGPKDYTTTSPCLDEGGDLFYLDPPYPQLQAIAAPPTSSTPPMTSSSSSKKNGVHKKSEISQKKKKNGTSSFNSTPPSNESKKKAKMLRNCDDLEEIDDSDDDYSWRDQSRDDERRGGGIWIIRFVCDAASWAFFILFGSTSPPTSHKSNSSSSNRSAPEDDDGEESSTLGDEFEKKNGRTDSMTSKSRGNTMTSLSSTSSRKPTSKTNGKPTSHHQKTNGHVRSTTSAVTTSSASAAIRDSSHDTNASNEAEMRSLSRELEALRAELSSKRSLEDDYRLQVSMHESNESRLSQQLSNMKLKVDQMEIKCSTLERHRESDKSQLEQSERKYAELMGKKTEIETTLSAERKARNESAGKKMDVGEHQRERERQLESEIDKLRAELKSKDETNMRMEAELNGLRNYKEENDIEALTMQLRLVREKSQQMEESLAGENKLKQSLFKCLGDARDTIKSLERRVGELQKGGNSSTIGSGNGGVMNGHLNGNERHNGHLVSSSELNNENDTTASDQSSPHQHSAMGSPVPSSKMPLTVNVSNRGGSPFNGSEKMSPTLVMAPIMTGGPPPPDYMMAVGAAVAHKTPFSIRYNEFKHMPTGEHRLFDTQPPSVSAVSPTGHSANSDDDFLLNKGKFGAPSNPATRTA